jgi:ATP-binding cassette subfamily F protein 3
MALIQVNNLYKSFSGNVLFNNVSFNINANDKVALIGHNGAGKSTLIKMLLKLEELDVDPKTNVIGSVVTAGSISIGYLSQHSHLNENYTALEELFDVYNLRETYSAINDITNQLADPSSDSDKLMEDLAHHIGNYQEHDGYAIEAEIKRILTGLELQESVWGNKIQSLSGGQKTRVNLAKILIQNPDLLILDEPTNHLDLNAIEWLEEFLINYKKAFLLISHDIYFLDATVNRVFEIENKKLTIYKGNYTEYKAQKEIYLSGALKAFESEQDRIKKLQEFVLKYKAGQKAKQARGRQKMLDSIDVKDNPIINSKNASLNFQAKHSSAKKVLEVNNLQKSFNNNKLFSNINMQILAGDSIAIIGKNGIGKSSLLKIIIKEDTDFSGEVIIGEKVIVGYFGQEHKDLNLNNTIIDEVSANFDITEAQARALCGQMLFSQDDVFKKVKSLSGGERARVAFIKLILTKPNFLILDEPTNHLDIKTKEILINALADYDGTILAVSHDRHFLDSVVNKIYLLTPEKIIEFDGNYSEYKKNNTVSSKISSSKNSSIKNKDTDIDIELQNQYNKLEKQISQLAEKEATLQKKYAVAGKENNLEDLVKIQKQLDEIEEKFLDLTHQSAEIIKQLDEYKKS